MNRLGKIKSKTYVLATVTVVFAAVSGIGVRSGGAAESAPTLTVTPNTGLADTQTVTLSGSGFDVSTLLISVECTAGATTPDDCDFSTIDFAETDSTGAISGVRAVRRLIQPFDTVTDCASAGCVLAVTDGESIVASTPIAFDPSIPPVLPKLTARPATGLRDHQLIAVSGTGFTPDSPVDLVECLAADPSQCAYSTDRSITTSHSGRISTKTFAVQRVFETFDGENIGEVDCAEAPNTCVLTAGDGFGGGGVPSIAPLDFNPALPPIVSSISVSASPGLADLENVTVTGTGFLPGSSVAVEQCAAATFACSPFPASLTAGFTGDFIQTYSVRRLLPTFSFNGLRTVDCALKAGKCMMAAGDGGSEPASAPLGFDRNKPAVASAITATPNSHLHDNQRLDVVFSGFSNYQPVAMIECTAKALTSGNPAYCDVNTIITTTTPAAGGNPSVAFFARRTLELANGLVDCAAKPGACVLIASSQGSEGALSSQTVTDAVAALSKHPTAKAAALLPGTLTPQALSAASLTRITGIGATPLSFDP